MLRRVLLPLILLVPLLVSARSQAVAGGLAHGPTAAPAPPPPPPPSGVSYLQASPYEGHVGDTIRVSGANLTPFTQYSLFMTCPAYTDPTVYQWGNVVYIAHGPITDAHGNFVRFQMTAITLHRLSSSPCYIYAEIAGQGGGNPNIPASYFAYPPGAKLSKCATQICGQVTISPSPPRSGHIETLQLTTEHFAGAFADITITFSNGKPMRITRVMDPEGKRYVRVRIPAGVPRITKEQVTVRFHVGRFTGTTKTTQFVIVR